MFYWRKQNIFLIIGFVFIFSTLWTLQAQAEWVVCDSWICATPFDYENFGVMCYSTNKAEDCANGGRCNGSTNMDCGGWTCPDATITCYEPPPPPPPPDPDVYGCTNPLATNFNPDATADDGSCNYWLNLNFIVNDTFSGGPAVNATVNINQDFGNGTVRTTDGNGFANFGVLVYSDIVYTVSKGGCSSASGSVHTQKSDVTVGVNISCIPPVYGCTDPSATNYNPAANINDGSCSYCAAGTGNACSSSANACGQANSGTIQCDGSCNAGGPPANPPGYGNACTSAPNACGQTNQGTIQCNGSCSASTPPNSSCPAPNSPTNVTVTESNYCVSGPAATIGWTYSDPSGSPQSAYEVQMDEQGSFQVPEYQTGKVISNSNSNFTGQGVLQFNKTYKTRARVWNSFDVVSGWTVAPGNFNTPPYAYPQVDFSWTANGVLNNPSPPLNKPVTFTDATVFNGNPNGRRWDWAFGDGGTADTQNTSHTYLAEGSYYITLTATDNANQTCIRTKGPLIIQKPIPRWREIAPK